MGCCLVESLSVWVKILKRVVWVLTLGPAERGSARRVTAAASAAAKCDAHTASFWKIKERYGTKGDAPFGEIGGGHCRPYQMEGMLMHQLRFLWFVLLMSSKGRVWVIAVGWSRPQRGIAMAAVDPLCQGIRV